MSEHTKGPWEIYQGQYDESNDEWIHRPHIRSVAPNLMGNIICEAPTDFLLSMIGWEANFRRIVACVNFCQGVDTKTLNENRDQALTELADMQREKS